MSSNGRTDENCGYKAPTIVEIGTLTAMTLGNKTGNALDATFPSGTSSDKLTFS
jgi:hypothetical protein